MAARGVRRGKGVFSLAAKGAVLHLGGSIAALAGSGSVLLIGLSRKNLSALSYFSCQRRCGANPYDEPATVPVDSISKASSRTVFLANI